MVEFFLSVFILSFLIQAFYLLFIFSKLVFYRELKANNSGKGISIIVAAHNERKNLERLIPLLLSQKYPDFEIIIADDRSTDESDSYISSLNDSRVRLISIKETPEGFNSKKYALTKAIQHSSKEILVLTDADCYPKSDQWLMEMQSGFEDGKEIVLGYSPYKKSPGLLNLFIRYETFYTAIQYLSFAVYGKPYMGVGRNLAYLKKVFVNNEGFNKYKSVTGGDDDLFIGQVSFSINTSVRINPASQMVSIPKKSYKEFFRQKTRHLGVGRHYSFKNRIKTGLLPLSHAFLYLSVLILSFFNYDISAVLSIFILRTLVLIVIFALISRKLGETIKWLWFPILDLFYLVNYIIIGVTVVFSKNIKWT